ncbi:hypothetical protein BLAT2472_30635 [Burkholderia latens]
MAGVVPRQVGRVGMRLCRTQGLHPGMARYAVNFSRRRAIFSSHPLSFES